MKASASFRIRQSQGLVQSRSRSPSKAASISTLETLQTQDAANRVQVLPTNLIGVPLVDFDNPNDEVSAFRLVNAEWFHASC